VDGASWDVIDTLRDKGRLPHFEYLISHGASGVLETLEPTVSPALWTSMFTGRLPSAHRVEEFSRYRFLGMTEGAYVPEGLRRVAGSLAKTGLTDLELVSTRQTRKPTLWNIVNARDCPVVVTGPLLSWPAEKVEGTFSSDRIFEKLREVGEIPSSATEMRDYLCPPRLWQTLIEGHTYEELTEDRDSLNSILYLEQSKQVEQACLGFVYLRQADITSHTSY
jgi:predicted AlkP superfamily phosphohydrolase/phosphomutase